MPNLCLDSKQLTADIKLQDLPFSSMAELIPSSEFVGQERAKNALKVGLATNKCGYNLFVMGNTCSGRVSLTMQCVETASRSGTAPADWVYVNNFDDISEPRAIQLPAGLGKQFIKDCQKMVDRFLVAILDAFDSPAYQRQKSTIDKSFSQQVESVIEAIEREANQKNIALYQDDSNVSFSPIIDGEPVDDIKFSSLNQDERNKINQTIDELEAKLTESLIEVPLWKHESNDSLHHLKTGTIESCAEALLNEMERDYHGIKGVQFYLKEVRRHLVEVVLNNFELIEESDAKSKHNFKDLLHQTFVGNLLVSNSPSMGDPVIYEPRPTFANLFGRIEHWSERGAITTNFQHIHSGALHRANGGYLILEVEKLFTDQYLWSQLKQALQTQVLKFEPPISEGTTAVSTALNPHGVPLKLKLILVGSREHYYLLEQTDPEFKELFRILIDFDEQIDRNPQTTLQFAQLVRSISIKEGYAPTTLAAFIELIKYSCRLSGHQNKLSARFGEVFKLLGEANNIRQQLNEDEITRQHILQSQIQREERHSRIRNEMLEAVLENQIIINTDGQSVGDINGLTIWSIGSTEFAMPARITATASPGSKGIVDIERESELGLSIHSKGVLILSGYLANFFAQDFPLTLSANIVMEQSYGFVDGDSASLAELCALVSAISGRPISQSFAVTGSINQFGEVQAVGGVNEKIEGFFLLCQSRGLNGEQAVIIPYANLSNLMLKQPVIDAVENQQFKIYALKNVAQAYEVLGLTGDGSIQDLNLLIKEQLIRLYELSKKQRKNLDSYKN